MKKSFKIGIIAVFLLAIISSLAYYAINNSSTPRYDVKEINKGENWKQVADDIFISTGSYFKVNMVLVISDGEAAIIDTGFNNPEATMVKEYIEKNNLKLSKLFITHSHIDHTNNILMFDIEEENIYDFNNITEGQTVEMGDKTFKILLTPGHANDRHFSVELTKERILIAGDVVLTDIPSGLAFGGDSHALKSTLEKIKKSNYALIIPGHGDLLESKLAVDVQLQYIKKAKALITEIINSGGSIKDAEKITLEECSIEGNIFEDVAVESHLSTIRYLYYEIKKELKNK